MVSVRNLTFFHNAHQIFDDVSFYIVDGQKVGLIGSNGAGKSTLLKILCKEEVPQTGKIEITGTIGIVPQEVKHDSVMEASTSIQEYLNPEHRLHDYEIEKMIRGVELDELDMDSPPNSLSGGQKLDLH